MDVLFSVADLENMNSSDLAALIDSITDEQAADSDIGGDSDAEDSRNYSSTSRSQSTTTSTSGNQDTDSRPSVRNNDSDSELDITVNPELVQDPTYITPNLLNQETDSESDQDVSQDFEFTKNPCTPITFENFSFNQEFGPNVEIDISSPLSIFLIIIADMLTILVEQSNLYANQAGVNLNLNLPELKAFIGILIVMGYHKVPSLRLYWSADENFGVPRISKVMSLKRFLQILRYVHINDNSKMPNRNEDGYDKLYKLRPMLTYLTKKFLSIFKPSRYLSIDESMVGFKGRSYLKQYLPMKPTKRGFKIWSIACATTGFLIAFKVYEGKTGERRETTLGEEIVLGLSESFKHLGYCLFLDRFFTTLPLLKKLLSLQLFGCGTIMSNRKHFPSSQLRSDKQLKTGEMDFATSGELSVSKWKDRGSKCVLMASNMHNPKDGTYVLRRNKQGQKEQISCPKSVHNYNKYMGGVDQFDHNMASYSISQKSRRWWMKIFYFLIDASIVNSYILYKTTVKLSSSKEKPLTQLMFRKLLADELISTFCSRPRKGRKPEVLITKNKMYKKNNGKGININHLVNVGTHIPVKGTCRRCAYCSTKQAPKKSQIMCKACEVNFCLECFAVFHEQ